MNLADFFDSLPCKFTIKSGQGYFNEKDYSIKINAWEDAFEGIIKLDEEENIVIVGLEFAKFNNCLTKEQLNDGSEFSRGYYFYNDKQTGKIIDIILVQKIRILPNFIRKYPDNRNKEKNIYEEEMKKKREEVIKTAIISRQTTEKENEEIRKEEIRNLMEEFKKIKEKREKGKKGKEKFANPNKKIKLISNKMNELNLY